MAAPIIDLHDEVIVVALEELREARRRRRLGEWNIIDALYKAYVTGIVATFAVTLLSGVVGDDRLGHHATGDLRDVGPAIIGLVVAVVLALGLRSGARGGPLALEAAEVRTVLLAPVDRDIALRAPARRQLRFASFAGSVTGAAIGLLAYRRLPGAPVAWVAVGALIGLITAIASTGLAMLAAGRRMSRRSASAAAIVLIAWSGVDIALRRVTSPTTFVGELALAPLHWVPASGFVVLAALGVGLAGLASIGGMSLEAAERRGRLVTHLRFAATFQDLRTVMLLRRQLSAELPRSKPWVRLRPARRGPQVWRRDWRAILRWPAVRLARLAFLGALAGGAAAAAWAGTTPVIFVAGIAMFVAGLDATEGLAQEVDHPDRRDSFPVAPGVVHLRHLAAPTVVLSVVGLVGLATAAAISGDPRLVIRVGLPLLLPAAAMGVGAAAVSALRQPPDPARLMMDSTGAGLLFHHAWPPLLATAGPAAVLLVHSQLNSTPDADPGGLAVTAAVNVVLIATLVFAWVRHRDGMGSFFGGQGLSESVGK